MSVRTISSDSAIGTVPVSEETDSNIFNPNNLNSYRFSQLGTVGITNPIANQQRKKNCQPHRTDAHDDPPIVPTQGPNDPGRIHHQDRKMPPPSPHLFRALRTGHSRGQEEVHPFLRDVSEGVSRFGDACWREGFEY